MQSGVFSGVVGAVKFLDAGAGAVIHFVVGMEGGDVPGDVRGDAGDELSNILQFFGAVVESRDDQGDNLDPESHGFEALDGVEDGLEGAAEVVVVGVVEGFEVHFIQADAGAEKVEDFGAGVSVADESADDVVLTGQGKDSHGPIGGDERFIVGADDDGGVVVDGHLDDLVCFAEVGIGDGALVAEDLAADPVLAVGTVEVATEHAEGEGLASGECMEEGLFFDGIDLESCDIAAGRAQFPVAVEAYFADAGAAFADEAAVSARETTQGALFFTVRQGRCTGNGVLLQQFLQARAHGNSIAQLEAGGWRRNGGGKC